MLWIKVRRKAGVKGRWHDNRQTHVTELAEAGAGGEVIMSIAGHVSHAMLSRYLHRRPDGGETPGTRASQLHYTPGATRAYLRTVEDFARYFKRPPDQLGPERVRKYIVYLFRERKLTDNTVNQRVGALRFFFIKPLTKSWSVEETPYPKKRLHLTIRARWGEPSAATGARRADIAPRSASTTAPAERAWAAAHLPPSHSPPRLESCPSTPCPCPD